MRRGATSAKSKVQAKLPVARKSSKNAGSRVRDLKKRLAESLEREKATGELLQEKDRALTEALDQQTATSEILRVISSSPTDLQPVLDAVAASSARLCDAQDAAVIRLGADGCRVVARYGLMSWPGSGEVVPLSRTTPAGRSLIDRRTVHVYDLAAALSDYPDSQVFVERFGTRTVLAAPLLRESMPVGCITIRRQEVRPFSDK